MTHARLQKIYLITPLRIVVTLELRDTSYRIPTRLQHGQGSFLCHLKSASRPVERPDRRRLSEGPGLATAECWSADDSWHHNAAKNCAWVQFLPGNGGHHHHLAYAISTALDRRTLTQRSDAPLGCFFGWRFWLCRKLKYRGLLTVQ
jgi:hypothetical protein